MFILEETFKNKLKYYAYNISVKRRLHMYKSLMKNRFTQICTIQANSTMFIHNTENNICYFI